MLFWYKNFILVLNLAFYQNVILDFGLLLVTKSLVMVLMLYN